MTKIIAFIFQIKQQLHPTARRVAIGF